MRKSIGGWQIFLGLDEKEGVIKVGKVGYSETGFF